MLKLILMVSVQRNKPYKVIDFVQHQLAQLKNIKTAPFPIRHFNNDSVTKYICLFYF